MVIVWSSVGVVSEARQSDPVKVVSGFLLPVTAPLLKVTQIYNTTLMYVLIGFSLFIGLVDNGV